MKEIRILYAESGINKNLEDESVIFFYSNTHLSNSQTKRDIFRYKRD